METFWKGAKIYLGIGIAVLVMQRAGAEYLEAPMCEGLSRHALVRPLIKRKDDATVLLETATGVRAGDDSGPETALRVVREAALWAPSLVRHVVLGDMRVGDYVRGGYVCEPLNPALRDAYEKTILTWRPLDGAGIDKLLGPIGVDQGVTSKEPLQETSAD